MQHKETAETLETVHTHTHTHTQVFLYKCVNLLCLQYKRGTNNTYAEDSRVGFVCVAQNNIKEIIGYILETRKLEKCF